MIPWYDKPASSAQLRYLRNLGYVEPVPLSMAEASAAIDNMLQTGDPAAAYQEILAERRERRELYADVESEADYRTKRGRSAIVSILSAPFVMLAHLVAAVLWLVSRLVAMIAWMISILAMALIWFLSLIGAVAHRSASATIQTGREKVIPWIGAQDWRSMAAGCRVQVLAAARQIDGLLATASGEDRLLLQILRFATAAGGTIAIAAVLLSAF